MDRIQAASYARVSSEQQAEANTVASQVAALQARVAEDGLALPEERQFVDEGYSGATLIRPALERLRDLVAAGGVDRLYVHSPDRLARKYAYQVLLIDEFQRAGVEVVFLNRELGRTPEDELLLQVQGMVAEYERAKILERSRRGKRHAAHSGEVSVLSTAPYGYLYIRKQDSGGEGRFEILLEEARVVRQVFAWVGRDRLSIGEVVRRLNQAGERTRTGKTVWDRTTVWGMLKNPAYMGQAAFGKTRVGPLQPRLRAQRGGSLQPRRAYSTSDVRREEWIAVPVPALVSEELFAAVQGQLEENRRRARQGQRGARYLLQGLVLCQHCGYAFYGKPVSSSAANGKVRDYAYYRCIGTDAYRFGGERVCQNNQVRTDLLDVTVWQEVCALLEDPQRVEQEYRRRLTPADTDERRGVESQLSKLRQGLARLIDSYAEGLIEKTEFEPRIGRLRERIAALEEQAQQLAQAEALQEDLRVIIGRLEAFAASVKGGLAEADWSTRRELIRALVKRVEIGQEEVNVVFRVNPDPFVERLDRGVLQHCGGREHRPCLLCMSKQRCAMRALSTSPVVPTMGKSRAFPALACGAWAPPPRIVRPRSTWR
jgi:site-specific DNA recombinase